MSHGTGVILFAPPCWAMGQIALGVRLIRAWTPKGKLDGRTNCMGRFLPQSTRKLSPGAWTSAAGLQSAYLLSHVNKGKNFDFAHP